MLDAYIIDQIRRRHERRREEERPSIRIPLGPPPGWEPEVEAEDEPKRVVIIDPDEPDDNSITFQF